jgi:eukaryotic-like serine/threonine-protein kinase
MWLNIGRHTGRTMSFEAGQIIEDKYRITGLIGEGGMGAVYEGENVKIQRKVAIKILHEAAAAQQSAVSRFEKEAQAAGRIGSDHITEVLDVGLLPGGEHFMVMEYLDGVPLSHRIKENERLTASETAQMAVQLLEGLHSAHQAGIIHRDLKPDNVFLLRSKAGRKDFVKILDFGISKFNVLSGDSAMSMTSTGAVMGTPYYMSPEQAKGSKDIDARIDIYAIGVILYECVTGRVPFLADTFNELVFKIVLEAPEPLGDIVPDLDENFVLIVNKAMARSAEDRFANALEFQSALLHWLENTHQNLFQESMTFVHSGAIPAQTSGSLQILSQSGSRNSLVDTNERSSLSSSAIQPEAKRSPWPLVAVGVAAGLIMGVGGIAYALKGSSNPSNQPATNNSAIVTTSSTAPPPEASQKVVPPPATTTPPPVASDPPPSTSVVPEPTSTKKKKPPGPISVRPPPTHTATTPPPANTRIIRQTLD